MIADIVRMAAPSEPWTLTLHGNSMAPFILDGDKLLVVPRRRPKLGDVIVFPHNELLVAHRIIGIGRRYITAGDASSGNSSMWIRRTSLEPWRKCSAKDA